MSMRLISSRVCPYVQRVRIVLSFADIGYEIEHINLKNPPDWFGDVSPLKKVPVLQVGRVAIFDSSIICDFLDQEYKLNLLPKDNLQRAAMRTAVEYIGACTQQFFSSLLCTDDGQFKIGLISFQSLLCFIERYVKRSRGVNLIEFSMIDVAIAPLLLRIDYVEELTGEQSIVSEQKMPALFSIKRKLVSHPDVIKSLDEDSKETFFNFLKSKSSIIFSYSSLSA